MYIIWKKRVNNCKILIMCIKCYVCICYMYIVINKYVYCNKLDKNSFIEYFWFI